MPVGLPASPNGGVGSQYKAAIFQALRTQTVVVRSRPIVEHALKLSHPRLLPRFLVRRCIANCVRKRAKARRRMLAYAQANSCHVERSETSLVVIFAFTLRVIQRFFAPLRMTSRFNFSTRHSGVSSPLVAGPEQSQSAEDHHRRSIRFQSDLVCPHDGW